MIMKYPFDSVIEFSTRTYLKQCILRHLMLHVVLRNKRVRYESYNGPSEGKLQFDMWSDQGQCNLEFITIKPRLELTSSIKTHGVRNSLLVAPIPTASTAQILVTTRFRTNHQQLLSSTCWLENFL